MTAEAVGASDLASGPGPGMPSRPAGRPAARTVLELLKPITWFAPIWAFGCGVISSGVPLWPHAPVAILGMVLAGPLMCGSSQVINDWFDRHVDAINEPGRPIPSGRIPGLWGLRIAAGWMVLSLAVAALLGPYVWVTAALGMVLAWIYSAPPLRLKRNGWWGNLAVGLSYEGLPWFAGAAVMRAGLPDARVIALALAYSIGAHGIMTLNDFKAIEGDRVSGIGSLPVRLGAQRAARFACLVMTLPQLLVIGLLLHWGAAIAAGAVVVLLGAQFVLMRRLLRDPRGLAPWYNATGTSLYVLGMLAAALALHARP